MGMEHSDSLQRLKQALEELKSALLEFEQALNGRSSKDPQSRGPELLSIPEVCHSLGMGKSWVYRRIKSGEIPSVKLGRSIKVKSEDLEGYLESQRYQPAEEE
jgi:excisionase family DNA binding protein